MRARALYREIIMKWNNCCCHWRFVISIRNQRRDKVGVPYSGTEISNGIRSMVIRACFIAGYLDDEGDYY